MICLDKELKTINTEDLKAGDFFRSGDVAASPYPYIAISDPQDIANLKGDYCFANTKNGLIFDFKIEEVRKKVLLYDIHMTYDVGEKERTLDRFGTGEAFYKEGELFFVGKLTNGTITAISLETGLIEGYESGWVVDEELKYW